MVLYRLPSLPSAFLHFHTMILQRLVGDAEFLGCDEIGFFVNVLVPGHKSALASLKVKTPSSVTQKSAFAKSNRSKNVIKLCK